MTDRHTIELTSQAKKDIKSHRSHKDRILRALRDLEQNPELGNALSGSLKGARSLEFTVKGSGAFRAAYLALEEERICLVFIVGPHENIYDRATRRFATLPRAFPSEPNET